MKKLLLPILATMVLLFGCMDKTEKVDVSIDENGYILQNLTASFESYSDVGTKTYVEDGKLRWHSDDEISAFYGNTLNRKYSFTGKTGANGGDFEYISDGTLGTGNPLPTIYSVYPYLGNTIISDEGEISVDLPYRQHYAEGSFGKNANVMVAATNGIEDTFLSFKNVGGYLKFKFYSDSDDKLKKMVVRGNNGEKISGPAKITHSYSSLPAVVMESAARTSIVVDCGDGIVLGKTAETATEVWVVIPPTEFAEGITVEVYSDNSGRFIKSTSQNLEIERNVISSMEELSCVFEPYEEEGGEDYEEEEEEETVEKVTYTITYTTVDDDMLYFRNMPLPLDYEHTYDNNTNVGSIKVYGVPEIESSLFRYQRTLKSVTIPEEVISIGNSAFFGCTALTEITLPSGLVSIGGSAFSGCTALTEITLPSGLVSIGSNAFYGCTALTEITLPSGLVSIGSYAFYGCTALTEITLPSGLVSIGSNAFYGCTALTEITLPSGLVSIGNYAFSGCTGLVSVTIPSSLNSDYSASAFNGCTNLTEFNGNLVSQDKRCVIKDNELLFFASGGISEYVIPSNVTAICERAFYNCDGLTAVTLPSGLVSIGSNAFNGCTALTEITFPVSLVSIGDFGFYDCSSLETINNLTDDVTVGKLVFAGCDKLAQNAYDFEGNVIGKFVIMNGVLSDFVPDDPDVEYSVVVPDGVTKIESSVFAILSNMVGIRIPDTVVEIEGSFYLNTKLSTIEGKFCTEDGKCLIVDGELKAFAASGISEYVLPDNITEIAQGVFRGEKSLTKIQLPAALKSIGSSAFSDCSSLTSISLPESLTTIGSSAFSRCSSLTSISLPESLTTIGSSAFSGCSIKRIVIPSTVSSLGSGAFSCRFLSEVIINSESVTIGDNTFSNYSNLERVVINGNVQIEDGAFKDMVSLLSFEINGSVTSVGDGAFEGCTELTSMSFTDGLARIGNNAFKGCTNLRRVTLPESLVFIGSSAFDGCSRLSGDIVFPEKQTRVYGYTFNNCNSLNSVILNNNITTIGDYAFNNCCNLEEINLPASLTSIGVNSFAYCSLKEVVIPENVSTIGDYAFYHGIRTGYVYCKAINPPTIFAGTFGRSYDVDLLLNVPVSSVELYKSVDAWKSAFWSIIGFDF